MGNDPTPRPGFDYWVSFPGQGRTVDPELFEDGALRRVEGYVTDLLTDRAVGFIERPRRRPYLLYLAHKAIHPDARQLDDGSIDLSNARRYIPAPRHTGVFDDRIFPRRGNAAPPDRAMKPVVRRALDDKSAPETEREFGSVLDHGTSEENIRRRAEMLLAVDEGLGRIFAALERAGTLDRTAIIFTSDNGYFFGEHGLSIERRLPYEEAARAPLLIRYSPLAKAGSRVDRFALSIDLAPTVLALAGAEIPGYVQGRSLLPLLRNAPGRWRDAFLIEYASHENPMPWLLDLSYRAVRSGQYKYIHWLHHDGEDELYDLAADPLELRNLAREPGRAELVARLRAQLGALVLEAMTLRP
jgi:N-acetylglucosamine-6-sulfatase